MPWFCFCNRICDFTIIAAKKQVFIIYSHKITNHLRAIEDFCLHFRLIFDIVDNTIGEKHQRDFQRINPNE